MELGRTGVRSDGPADCGVIPPAAPSSLPPGCCEGLAERLNSANARCFMRLEIVGDWCDEAWRGCLPGAFAGRGCKQARQTHCEAAQHSVSQHSGACCSLVHPCGGAARKHGSQRHQAILEQQRIPSREAKRRCCAAAQPATPASPSADCPSGAARRRARLLRRGTRTGPHRRSAGLTATTHTHIYI